jgi:hypothetical protein
VTKPISGPPAPSTDDAPAPATDELPAKPAKEAPITPNRQQRGVLTGPEYWLTWGFAVVLVIVFVIACVILYQLADNEGVNEVRWHRYVYVFSAFEAIVFTAVGWVFGREVHRSTAERAIADASDRKQEAKNTADEAKNGYALAQAIKGSVAALGEMQGITDSSPPTAALPSHLLSLKKMADKFYP